LKAHLSFLLLLIVFSLSAQYHYTIDQSIPVEANGKQLANPWAGGFNSALFNTVDLNGDNLLDAVVFDRGAGKIFTYVRRQGSYKYAPEYEEFFPEGLSTFMLLRDYNCDGKKDLFTFNDSENGISVYKNTTVAGQHLSWQLAKTFVSTTNTYSDILLTKGFTSLINILPGAEDIPNIIDMDGDGDLDILNMRFVNPSTAEYHKNFSMERFGKCDSLVFERQTQRWGDWEECSCGNFAFGGASCPPGGRTEHTGGKVLLTLDVNNDGDQDVLFSEETCSRLYLLTNTGTSTSPLITSSSIFPSATPVAFPSFPSPFLEDVDFDGLADLVVTPNLEGRNFFSTDFSQSLWYYKNTGTPQLPQFTFVKKNFLQEGMIDVGDNSVPAFTDADGDGDQDLFIGTFTSADFAGRIFFYENVGTLSNPSFRLITDNYQAIGGLRLYNLKPQFADVNADGTLDLVFLGTGLSTGKTNIYYLENKNSNGLLFTDSQFPMIELGKFGIGVNENILLRDIDKDGVIDFLVGRSSGALEYWENTASPGSFNFVLQDAAFLGIAAGSDSPNLSMTAADLDADGYEELVTGDRNGSINVYNNFLSTSPIPQKQSDVIYNFSNETYGAKNLGGKVWPAVANLFNTDRPSLAVGNTTGGIYILKNDDSEELPEEPVITVSPNPVVKGETLTVKSDRNISVQIYSMLGQKISNKMFVPAYQSFELSLQNIASGTYIARFELRGKSYGKLFMVD
jgi:hypothetical protein